MSQARKKFCIDSLQAYERDLDLTVIHEVKGALLRGDSVDEFAMAWRKAPTLAKEAALFFGYRTCPQLFNKQNPITPDTPSAQISAEQAETILELWAQLSFKCSVARGIAYMAAGMAEGFKGSKQTNKAEAA